MGTGMGSVPSTGLSSHIGTDGDTSIRDIGTGGGTGAGIRAGTGTGVSTGIDISTGTSSGTKAQHQLRHHPQCWH